MKKIFLFALAFLLTCLTGCYDNREIDTLANVLVVGVESVDNGEKLYTFAVGNTGGFGSDSSGDGATLLCYTAISSDIAEAVSKLNSRISKKLSFAHISAILFSTETARKGIIDDVGFFEKNFKVRPQVSIALTEFSPSVYLEKLLPCLEPNVQKYFQGIFNSSDLYVPNVNLGEFINSYYCGYTVVAPILLGSLDSDEVSEVDVSPQMAGIITGDKLVTKTADTSFLGLFWSRQNVKYKGAVLQSTGRPKIKIKGAVAEIEIFAKCKGDFNEVDYSKNAEEVLKKYSSMGIDAVNIMYFARKNYVFYDDYLAFKAEKPLLKMNYSVKVNVERED